MHAFVKDLLSTRKMRKFRSVSYQNSRDHMEIVSRLQSNGVKIDLVTEILEMAYGGHFTVEALLNFARNLAKVNQIKIDRLAYRNRSALLCWYSENWNLITPHLHDFKNYNVPKPKDLMTKMDHVDPSDIHQLLNYH